MLRKHSDKRLLIGLLILCLGIFLILNKLSIIPDNIKDYLFHWELILVGIGVISVIQRGGTGPGYIFILVGGLLYTRNFFEIFSFNFWQLFWPVVLIFVGLLIITRRRNIGKCYDENNELEEDNDVLDEIAVFGGSDKLISSQNFKGGKVTAIFGGTNLNLSRAKLNKNMPTIDVIAIFGGLKLIVPEEWDIHIKVNSIFGGFSDKHRIKLADPSNKEANQLRIKGLVIFGGGEIKSY